MERGPSNPIIGIILGCLCLGGGYYVYEHVGKPMRARAAASATWPTTDGQITRSMLHREDPRHDQKAMFSMDIGYDYTLNGRKLEGKRIWFGDQFSSSDPEHFQAAVNRYPVGREVKVFYDPAEPGESVLEPGSTWSASIWYLVGLGLMVFGGLVLLSASWVLVFVVAAFMETVGGSRDEMTDFERPTAHLGTQDGDRGRPGHEDDGIDIV